MRLLTWHLASALGPLVGPAPHGKLSRTLIVPIGDGSCLEALTGSWYTEVFGIEPSPANTQRVSLPSTQVLCCAFPDARLGHGGWSGVVIELPDPPTNAHPDALERYDLRVAGSIRRAAALLVPKGVLVAIGHPQAFSRPVAYTLDACLTPLHVFAEQDGKRQTLAVLGTLQDSRGRIFHHHGTMAERARPLEQAGAGLVTLPPAPVKTPVFAAAVLTWEQVTAEAAKHGVWVDLQLLSALWADKPWDLHPLMPLARGHLGQLIAAGAFNNVLLTGPDGRPILIKGRTDKIRRIHEDGPARTIREAFRTSAVTLDPATGTFRVVDAGGEAMRSGDCVP